MLLMLRELGRDEGLPESMSSFLVDMWIFPVFMLVFLCGKGPGLAPGDLAGATVVSLRLRIIIPNHVVHNTPCSLMSLEDIFILHLFCIIHYNSNSV